MSEDSRISDSQSQTEEDISIIDEQMEAYVAAITQENFWNYYATACRLKNENNFEEAMIIFKALMVKGTDIFESELSISLSRIYFQLGNALLEKLERETDVVNHEAPVIVAQSEGGQSKEQQHLHHPSAKEKARFDQQTPNEYPENNDDEDDERVEDIQIAWENLDVCRVIIEKHIEENPDLKEEERSNLNAQLANCYLRLGDAENWKEDFTAALQEYKKSLEIHEKQTHPNRLRRLSELHFLIGNTYLYEFKEKSMEMALEHYKNGKQALESKIAQVKAEPKSSSQEKEVIQLQDLIRSFEDKISEVKDELSMKEAVYLEKKKLQEYMSTKNNGFGKSEFDESAVAVKKLGKFGGAQKREPFEGLNPEHKQLKKICQNPPQSGVSGSQKDETKSSNQ